jgi:protocatechuate 3,4-dioxygenase beta subunit
MTRRGTEKAAPSIGPEPRATIVQVGPASTPPEASGSGALRLEGQVIDEHEQPVPGATVTLWPKNRIAVTREGDGSFAFDGLVAAQYRVVATKDDLTSEPTLVTLTEKNDPVIVHMRAGSTVVVHVLELDGGAPIANATVAEQYGRKATTGPDGIATLRGVGPLMAAVTASAPGHMSVQDSVVLGAEPNAKVERTIKLPRGASVSGVVLDPDDKPVASASIYAEASGSNAGHQIKAASDATGAWKFDALAAGKYALVADSEVYAQAPAQYIEVDGVHEHSGVIVHVITGAQLVGTVLNANGKPSIGASVSLVNDQDWHSTAKTDDHGKFKMLGTPAGAFHIWARNGAEASPRSRVDLVVNKRVEVLVKLEDSSIAGAVVDTKGEPVAEVTVYARPTTFGRDPGRMETTDSAGHFDFGGLPQGEYEVIARRPDEPMEGVPGKGQTVKTGDRSVKIVVEAVTSIIGRVVLDNHPVPSFGIVVSDRGNEMQWRQSFPSPITAPDGRFAKRAAAGDRTVVVFGKGFARKLIDVDVKEGNVTDLGDVVVDHGQRVTGHVVDSTGAPVEGATVTVYQQAMVRITQPSEFVESLQGGASATTDSAGAYTIEGIPPPTKMPQQPTALPNRIGASHPSHGVAPARDLSEGETTVDFVLKETGGIDGKIVGPASDHQNVWAALAKHQGEPEHSDIQRDRTFHFDKLAAGDYELTITRQNWDGYVPPPTRVTVVAGQRTNATITLPESVTLHVHIIDGTCDVVVLLKPGTDAPDPSNMLGRAICDGDHADVANVPPGRYRVCMDEKHCASVTTTSTPATQTVEIHAKP